MFTVPYTHHFGLKANPFSNVPDPRYLYLSVQHKEALAHLLYGLGTDGGVVLLTGEAGTGKTTVCRCLLDEMSDDVDVASIDEPDLTVEALVASACRGFGVGTEAAGSVKRHVDRLNAFLLANHERGRRSVLMVDEAQRLGADVLEQLRLLTNLETHERKLLQILLVGRPELRDLLARAELRQLSQRIVARFHLRPLACAEVADYVQHRLAIVGGHARLVPARLIRRLHALSKGVPRTINLLCDGALLDAAARGEEQVDAAGLKHAARQIGLPYVAARRHATQSSLAIAAGCVATMCVAAVALAAYQHQSHGRAPAALSVSSAIQQEPPSPSTAQPGDAGTAALLAVRDVQKSTPKFDWPDAATRDRSTTLAHAALLRKWGAAAHPREATCGARRSDGLRCLRGRGGLAELRAMNLPAVLHLEDDSGRKVDMLLLTASDDTVSLEIAGAEIHLSAGALARWWHGDYTLLWRAPAEYDHALYLGSRGPAVAWLRTRLALVQRESEPAWPEQPFDSSLLVRVREFQIVAGLHPDGMAGARTLASLAARTDPSVPVLAHTKR